MTTTEQFVGAHTSGDAENTTGPRQSNRPGAAPAAASPDRGRETQPPTDDRSGNAYQVRAKHLLKIRGMWTIPVIVGSVVLVLMTAFYVGSVVNPIGHLHGLPVSLVNEDAGATVGARHIDLGNQLQSGLTGSRTVSRLLSLTPERLHTAEDRMIRSGAYATVSSQPTSRARCCRFPGFA